MTKMSFSLWGCAHLNYFWVKLLEIRAKVKKKSEIKLYDCTFVKFIHSEKATKFCKISIFLLSYAVPVKNKVEISQNFVAFSEYMNLI